MRAEARDKISFRNLLETVVPEASAQVLGCCGEGQGARAAGSRALGPNKQDLADLATRRGVSASSPVTREGNTSPGCEEDEIS